MIEWTWKTLRVRGIQMNWTVIQKRSKIREFFTRKEKKVRNETSRSRFSFFLVGVDRFDHSASRSSVLASGRAGGGSGAIARTGPADAGKNGYLDSLSLRLSSFSHNSLSLSPGIPPPGWWASSRRKSAAPVAAAEVTSSATSAPASASVARNLDSYALLAEPSAVEVADGVLGVAGVVELDESESGRLTSDPHAPDQTETDEGEKKEKGGWFRF